MAAASGTERRITLAYRDDPAFDETAERNRRVLTDALDRVQAGDFGAFWDVFDPEVTFHEASCLPYGGTYRGIAETRRGHAAMSAHFAEMRTVIEGVLASRDLCVLYQTISFRTKATGTAGSFPVCEVFRFRAGKVVEWRACYFDACLMAEALAQAPDGAGR